MLRKGRSERGALTISNSVLCRSFPEIAGDVRLQVVVRRTAASASDRAGHCRRMVVRPAGAGCLPARTAAVRHIVIGRTRPAAHFVRTRRSLMGMRAVRVDCHRTAERMVVRG